ncbi:hypothetical protein ACT3R3_07245 [Glutamicibacter sp. AOP5-B1-3]
MNPAALALSFGSDLGPVAEDFNATVRSYGDQFFPSAVAGSTAAIDTTADAELSIEELFSPAADPKGTILVRADQPILKLLPYLIGQWKAGDGVVLVEDSLEVSDRLRDGERITFDYVPGA